MQITKQIKQLPVKIEDLHKFILIGREQINVQKAKIRAIEKIGLAHAAKEAALSDAQDIGDILLDAEAKLGEMIKAIKPKYDGSIVSSSKGTDEHKVPRQIKSLPKGITKKESHIAQTVANNPEIVQEVKKKAREEGNIPTKNDVIKAIRKKKSDELRAHDQTPNKGTVFNATNDNIEWAHWTWNPVTGCKHGCRYCYARDIANRFYKEKFEPTFRPYRLKAPQNTPVPQSKDIGDKNVFVCSMADLFGDWVPQEWIDKTLEAVTKAPQWNFLFLTKNPKRLSTIKWPKNAWVGTTVDVQARVEPAEKAFDSFEATVKFISCEPLAQELTFNNLEIFDWVIIGARSRNSKGVAKQPERQWVYSLMEQAYRANCMVYCKPNLKSGVKEYPH